MSDFYKIGTLAKETGVTVETLRFYEKQGLIPRPHRSEAGYRLYPTIALNQVAFILRAKEVGFSLKDISGLLALEVNRDQETCKTVKNFAEEKLADIEAKIKELEQMRNALKQITDACCGGSLPASHCTILSALAEGNTEEESTHVTAG
ncbi:Zn(2+)-responsive transcriptional regulator [Oceanospirillum maris]|uniref:Zn(2+)-responsive transcriptional regulator n=1 Tax=Oceanospirillum maris TaxID=64977 RepID=UPI00041C1EA3|nr:Zn(2+)-responsive transcriptional regulator [Oceanospirillum maris]